MLEGPRVNLDILYIITSLLEVPELLQLSTACKLYRAHSIKHILSFGVKIEDDEQLFSFFEFMLVDVSYRAPWIKSLVVRGEAFDWESGTEIVPIQDANIVSVGALASILEHCHRLTSLSIPSLDQFLAFYPRFGNSMKSLPVLVELELTELGESSLVAEAVCDMQSQLRILRMRFDPSLNRVNFPLSDPATSASTASVEVLDVDNVAFSKRGTQYSPWPSVRRLIVSCCDVELDSVYSLFPELQACEIDKNVFLSDFGSPIITERHNLDYLSIKCPLYGMWNSDFPIRHINLTDLHHYNYPNEPGEIFSLLRKCQPLVLSLCDENMTEYIDFRSWLSETNQNLRCLEIFGNVGGTVDLVSVIFQFN